MKDLYDIVNLSNIPLDKRIELSIAETKKQLNQLTTERTCIVYTNYLFTNLSKNHVVSKMVSTNELGAKYDHHFIVVPINTFEYYLVDLTYSQFNNKELFKTLYDKGYERVNDYDFSKYYLIVTKEQTNNTFHDIFMNNVRKR